MLLLATYAAQKANNMLIYQTKLSMDITPPASVIPDIGQGDQKISQISVKEIIKFILGIYVYFHVGAL